MTAANEEDLTRKQRREQAREERKAAEEAAAADATRKRRITQLAGVAAVVVAAIVVILIVTGGSSKPKPVTKHEATAISQQVANELAGIPQSGRTIGNPSAPVTIQYFGDLECPICKQFSDKEGALPKLIAGPVRAGKAKVEYMSMQTATREPEVFTTQQTAAYAAGAQNKAWHYIELFYNEQGAEDTGYVNEKYLQNLAQQIPGLDLAKWTTDRSNPKFAAEIAADQQAANNNGFNGTPSFLIGKSGGALKKYEYSSLTDPKGFEEAIEQAAKA